MQLSDFPPSFRQLQVMVHYQHFKNSCSHSNPSFWANTWTSHQMPEIGIISFLLKNGMCAVWLISALTYRNLFTDINSKMFNMERSRWERFSLSSFEKIIFQPWIHSGHLTICSVLNCLPEFLKQRIKSNLSNCKCGSRKEEANKSPLKKGQWESAVWEWEQLNVTVLCGTSLPPHVFFSLCLRPLRLSASPQVPSFFPSFVISQGAGAGTPRREVPTRLKLPACLSPFSLFFLFEVEHHRGVRFIVINCCLIPKIQHTHTLARLLWGKHMGKYSYKNMSHMQYVDMQVITLMFRKSTSKNLWARVCEQ